MNDEDVEYLISSAREAEEKLRQAKTRILELEESLGVYRRKLREAEEALIEANRKIEQYEKQYKDMKIIRCQYLGIGGTVNS